MPCKYHPTLPVKGQCSKCRADYCEVCDFEVIKGKEHLHLCLDCAKSFAVNRLIISVIFAVVGFIWGIALSKNLFVGFFYAYSLWGIYFGWAHQFWGGDFWQKLINLAKSSKSWGLFFLLLLVFFRIIASWFIGCFGNGIMQTNQYIKIIKLQKELSTT